ncbi:hypothetical protein SPM53_25140, partial [Enterobacter hormaechei subsp. hoffmannii]
CAACSSVITASHLSKSSTAWPHNHKSVVFESRFHNGFPLQSSSAGGLDNGKYCLRAGFVDVKRLLRGNHDFS